MVVCCKFYWLGNTAAEKEIKNDYYFYFIFGRIEDKTERRMEQSHAVSGVSVVGDAAQGASISLLEGDVLLIKAENNTGILTLYFEKACSVPRKLRVEPWRQPSLEGCHFVVLIDEPQTQYPVPTINFVVINSPFNFIFHRLKIVLVHFMTSNMMDPSSRWSLLMEE